MRVRDTLDLGASWIIWVAYSVGMSPPPRSPLVMMEFTVEAIVIPSFYEVGYFCFCLRNWSRIQSPDVPDGAGGWLDSEEACTVGLVLSAM